MSVMFEVGGSASATAIANLVKEWAALRQTKKEDELKSPEWQQLERAYVNHLLWRFDYPKKVFGQQILSNWIIGAMVLVLVVCGLVFSFIQLHYAIVLGDIGSLKSTIEIETAGRLSISSSIVGAITLVISLAFFGLYLKYVFQIKHPVPPHVSLSETDAASVLASLKSRSKEGGEAAEELQIVGIRAG
jgi:hypothetical protein